MNLFEVTGIERKKKKNIRYSGNMKRATSYILNFQQKNTLRRSSYLFLLYKVRFSKHFLLQFPWYKTSTSGVIRKNVAFQEPSYFANIHLI